MVRIVDDLLDVSRITQGKVELRKERLELWRRVVTAAVELCRPAIDAAGPHPDGLAARRAGHARAPIRCG